MPSSAAPSPSSSPEVPHATLPSVLFAVTSENASRAECNETNALITNAWASVADTITPTLLENRSVGVLACRDLCADERLVQEVPLLILSSDGMGRYDGIYPETWGRTHARLLLGTLSAAQAGQGELGAVIETNGIVVRPQEGAIFTAVHLLISRCNHSCRPNAHFAWDEESSVGCLWTKRPIRKGCEVLINYGARGCRRRRQRFLMRNFNFTCTCELCSLRGEALVRSDLKEEEEYQRAMATAWSSSEDDAAEDTPGA